MNYMNYPRVLNLKIGGLRRTQLGDHPATLDLAVRYWTEYFGRPAAQVIEPEELPIFQALLRQRLTRLTPPLRLVYGPLEQSSVLLHVLADFELQPNLRRFQPDFASLHRELYIGRDGSVQERAGLCGQWQPLGAADSQQTQQSQEGRYDR